MSQIRKNLGKKGEVIARYYLERKGYCFIGQNFQERVGEIDLIMRDKKTNEIVFVEVKTRRNQQHIFGEESVSLKKIRKMRKTAQIYLTRNHLDGEFARFDVLVVEIHGRKATILHLINVYY